MEARRRLADTTVDPDLKDMVQPSYAEILSSFAPGEVRYVWQMATGASSGDEAVDWINLPTVVCSCLDREYAKYVNAPAGSKLREKVAFGIQAGLHKSPLKFFCGYRFRILIVRGLVCHRFYLYTPVAFWRMLRLDCVCIIVGGGATARRKVNLGIELKLSTLLEKTQEAADGSRRLQKPSRAILVVSFDRRQVQVSLDGAPWAQVRCVKVSSDEGASVLVQSELVDLLKNRLLEYASDGEDEENQEDCSGLAIMVDILMLLQTHEFTLYKP